MARAYIVFFIYLANNLPGTFAFGRSARHEESFLLIGGTKGGLYNSGVYMFKPETDSWTLMMGQLATPRDQTTAMVVKIPNV